MADSQVKTANICNITSSTELRGNGGGTGTFLTNNSIKVYCNGSAYWSGVFFTSGSESLITGDKYTISFTPYCTNNNTIRVQFCGVADNYTFTSGIRKTITVTAVDTIRTVAFYAGDAVEKTIIIKDIQIEKGETATVYHPYSATGWVHSLRKLTTATEAVENPLYSDGTAITSYTIKGNTVQNGTPTPSNPITISGVGNKTANLFDYKATTYGTWTNSNGSTISAGYAARSASLNAETITVSCNGETKPYSYSIIWLDGNDTFISREHVGLASMIALPQTFTPPNNAVKYYMQVANGSDTSNPITESQLAGYKIMLNTGSTAQSYELYGYKIPISSGQTALTPIYVSQQLFKIGDTTDSVISSGTATYNIKKLVLTGQESFWTDDGTVDTRSRYRILPTGADTVLRGNRYDLYCTHFKTDLQVSANSVIIYNGTIGVFIYFYVLTADYPTLADFKTYIQQQYANGTPVTLYYILETPTTETVTAPSIPTTDGANTITVDTTVQPSEFTATWTGWHDASVQEYTGGAGNQKFDYTTMASGITGHYLSSAGVETASAAWAITDYIPCNGQSFTLGKIGGNAPSICLYDSNKTFIAGQAYNTGGADFKNDITVTASQNAKYIRFSYYIASPADDLSTIMLNEGTTALPYEPYEYGWV